MENQSFRRCVLFIAVIGSFLTPFMGAAVNLALPQIGREFGLDAISLSWLATAYLLAAAVFLLPFGRLADIVGKKRISLRNHPFCLLFGWCGIVPLVPTLIGISYPPGHR